MRNLKSKKRFKITSFILLAVMLLTFQLGSVLADNIKSIDSTLKLNETIDSTGIFTGDKIDIAGTVKGTTFAAGTNIDVSGVIEGDLFVAGQNVNISGSVNGSIIVLSQDINISASIENNIYSAGSNITLKSENNGTAFLAGDKIVIEKQANIAKDLFVGGNQVFQYGTLGRDLIGKSNNTSISGSVGRNVRVSTEDLYIEDAEIKGNLKYDSMNEATISKDSKIAGKTDWNKVEPNPQTSKYNKAYFMEILLSIINLLIVWILIALIRPRFWNTLALNIKQNPLKSLGFGALALIVIPTTIIFLLFSIFIYPLMFILICLYGISIYVSKIIVSTYIGRLIGEKFNFADKHKGIWSTLLGLVILSALGIIPIVGPSIKLITVLLGLGSIVCYVINGIRNN